MARRQGPDGGWLLERVLAWLDHAEARTAIVVVVDAWKMSIL
jgi:hypothetical protein